VRSGRMPIGRRERAKQDKHERIMTAARELFVEQGVSGVTTQQIADRADVAIGTLYRYASTKAELLIMAQNEKFAAAIDDGLAAADAAVGQGVLEGVAALIRPVVACAREQIENGRIYLHELVFGDPAEPYRFEEPLHRFQNMIIDRMVGIDRVPAGDDDTMTPMFVPPQTTAPAN